MDYLFGIGMIILNQISYDSSKILHSEYKDKICDLLKDEPSYGSVLIYNYLKKYKKSNVYLLGFIMEKVNMQKYKMHSFNKE